MSIWIDVLKFEEEAVGSADSIGSKQAEIFADNFEIGQRLEIEAYLR